MFKNYILVFYLFVLWANQTLAEEHLWFTGFSYNAPLLLSKPQNYWVSKALNQSGSQKLQAYINLANHQWLQRDLYKCIESINQAILVAKIVLPASDAIDFEIKARHMLWERVLFAGRWEMARNKAADFQRLPKNNITEALETYQRYVMMAKGDVAFVQADIPILTKLIDDLLELNYYRLAIKATMLQLNRGKITEYELKNIEQQLPENIKPVFALERYFYTYENKPTKLIELFKVLDTADYLSKFRVAIELFKEFGQAGQKGGMLHYQQVAKKMAIYLADADVDNHYSTTLDELRNKGLISKIAWEQMQLTNKYDWRQESRLNIFYDYNNQRVKSLNDSYLNQLRANKRLLVILSLLSAILMLTAAYLIKIVRIKNKLNAYRHRFLHALSHDLNATLLNLEQHIDSEDNRLKERLLLEHRMMLNDTLQWAYSAQQNKTIAKEPCSLSDLMHEVVEELYLVIKQKNLTINWVNDEDTTVILNKNAMLVALRNVLLNAIKHNYSGGFIEISVLPQQIIVKNSTKNAGIFTTQTGSFLINYFLTINSATYSLHLERNVATAIITGLK